MKTIHLIFIVLIIFTINSCTSPNKSPSEGVNYPFSNINCYLRYLEENRELQAEMTFRTDSNIAIEGNVFLNDEIMHYKNLPSVGMQYRLIKNAVFFDSSYTFSYIERHGEIVRYNIGLNKFENLRIVSDGLSKKKGGLLIWDGEALDTEDGLVFILTDSRGNSFSINHSGISKGNKFEIIASHVNNLATGPATLLTTRKKTVSYNNEKVRKLLRVEYYLKAIKFEVKE
ncbi:MAG: hypothetical protein MK207_11300 [Saprospiraceae bacterium]|nr:hypothetical protein [Saprospiraceae bacterium]